MTRAALLLAVLLALAAAPAARADGDPASDVLVSQDVFVSYSPPDKPLADALERTAAKARAAGFPIKVALIAGPQDLGAYARDFNDPNGYAVRLSKELPTNPHGATAAGQAVLVVMPNGFGGVALGDDPDAALDPIDIDAGARSNGLAAAAMEAVARIATANGAEVPVPREAGSVTGAPGGGSGSGLLYAVPVVLLLAGVLLARLRSASRDRAAAGHELEQRDGEQQDQRDGPAA